ncbi:hypothetical protein MIR68_009039 [Amoeboaphelidium protococcarum]|nr:hypothetical protein MIR68_009039 [Amoeboaphelidium protococcarum]KAI3648738.1 hypothetical protein MP228_006592 [Amoeboaphelidium protococcarum]KAI3649501.1 hypothetical protein MP228_005133 [Amoeboaphelidium protococcarum]
MTALFNFESLLLVILLSICTLTYVKYQFPSLLPDSKYRPTSNNDITSTGGVFGLMWKLARIGERLSFYVALCCIVMSVRILVKD